ncbi:HTH-type transcriptional repressor DasR [mine drainage metagenome]|uniref:HTH-type transcriptional repressor DasR n=1 Tax=mine drainage metagenome TaxID=410659 RepID=A0A1J5PM31_9ZZZZ
MPKRSTPLGGQGTLTQRLRDVVRARILEGEWQPGEKIPSESELAEQYLVSRVTLRTALKSLESQGLIDIRHGSGAYVSNFGTNIRAGLQELRSITETIRELGFEPSMQFKRVEQVGADEEQAKHLNIEVGAPVLYMERAILADGEIVAFSYDAVTIEGLPTSVVHAIGKGPVFAALAKFGVYPARAFAEIHAINSKAIGWGAKRPTDALYLLLDQVHFDREANPLMYSKTYFVEGRFQFVILRTS